MNAADVRLRVAALVETLGVDGFVTVAEVAEHVAASPRSIGQALKRLGFTMSRRKNKSRPRKDGTRIQYPALWRRPAAWPDWFEVERQQRAARPPELTAIESAVAVIRGKACWPWSLPFTKPRHLQLADPWGGRNRSARHCPSGRPARGEGLGRSVPASRAARSEWGRAPLAPLDISEALFGDSARPFSPSTRPKAGFRGAVGRMIRIRRRSASCR